MACSNCNCNSCKQTSLCGCPIDLSSLCVRYTLNKRLENLGVNEGAKLQDILVILDTLVGTILANQGTAAQIPFFDGSLQYFATGGETFISLTDTVNTSVNFILVRNGQVDLNGVGNEYTIDTTLNRINFTDPLEAGDVIQFFYYIQQ